MVTYLKLVPTYTYYWSFIDWHGEECDGDYSDQAAAQNAANDAYEEYCEEESDDCDEDIDIIRFYYDDESGERIVVDTIESAVYFEFQRSDYDEHRLY